MSKFLYCTDFHISGKTPCHRTDNYYESMLKKLDEVLEIAKEHNVDFIIDGGDFWHSSVVSNTMVDDVLDRIEKTGIKWYMLFGNHCQIGQNVENSDSTSLAHMFRRSDYVKHLDRLSDKNSVIVGFDYYHGIESDINAMKTCGLSAEWRDDHAKRKIAVIHAMITEKPFHPSVAHCVIGRFTCEFNLVLCGHNHSQFGLIKHENTLFVGIGAISRLTVSQSDLDIHPSVAIIDTEGGLDIIELKSAKPSKEVFDLTAVIEENLFENKISDFIKSLEDTKFQALNLVGVVKEIMEQGKCDKEIVDEVVKRIGIAEGCREI